MTIEFRQLSVAGSTNGGHRRYARFSWLDTTRGTRIEGVESKGCGAIGSATVSKTVGCRFESCHPCAVDICLSHIGVTPSSTGLNNCAVPMETDRVRMCERHTGKEDWRYAQGRQS